MFKRNTQYLFDSSVFQKGIAIKVEGTSDEGYEIDEVYLVHRNGGTFLKVVDMDGKILTIHSDACRESPAFETNPDYPEQGLTIKLMEVQVND